MMRVDSIIITSSRLTFSSSFDSQLLRIIFPSFVFNTKTHHNDSDSNDSFHDDDSEKKID